MNQTQVRVQKEKGQKKKDRAKRKERDCFSLTVKRLREDKGITQQELSETSGLHITHIALIEGASYTREPKLTTILKLAYGLGLTITELIAEYELSLGPLEELDLFAE